MGETPWKFESSRPHHSVSGRRIAVIGNAAGGKSTLARRIAAARGLPLRELDRIAWTADWLPTPAARFEAGLRDWLDAPGWVIEGTGRLPFLPMLIERASTLVLVDLPVWIHCALAAGRQTEWQAGRLAFPPGGVGRPPPAEALFRLIWEVDRRWMPEIRDRCDAAERAGTRVVRLRSLPQLDRYAGTFP